MSTSTKTPASVRHGGPGSADQNAKQPAPIKTPEGKPPRRSSVSGGGGEPDRHHTHDPARKGD